MRIPLSASMARSSGFSKGTMSNVGSNAVEIRSISCTSS
jgi:hypothetical protein